MLNIFVETFQVQVSSFKFLNSNVSEYDLFLQVKGPTDHGYFDSYPPEEEIPPDEMSGWDTDF